MSLQENSNVILLPTDKIAPVDVNPRLMIIYSKPKVGKTTLMAELPNNLILDFEKGSRFVNAMKIEVDSIAKLKEIGNAIKQANNPYDYITIDSGTALEDLCIDYAEEIYSQTPLGGNWFSADPKQGGKIKYKSILNLPNGLGYGYLRQAYEKVINYVCTLAEKVIILCHVKDASVDKERSEITALDLDLTGRNKRITAQRADAIGYMFRRGNKNMLTFKTNDDVACGARPTHLKNKEIVISEIDEAGNFKSHWDEIYV